GMLFHSLYNREAGAYTEQFVGELLDLDLEVFEKSWQEIVKGHSILRSAIYHDKFKLPVQCVYKEVSIPLTLLDWREKDDHEVKESLVRLEVSDRQRGFDFGIAPLFRI